METSLISCFGLALIAAGLAATLTYVVALKDGLKARNVILETRNYELESTLVDERAAKWLAIAERDQAREEVFALEAQRKDDDESLCALVDLNREMNEDNKELQTRALRAENELLTLRVVSLQRQGVVISMLPQMN